MRNVPYYFDSRVIFQSRSKFWESDRVSPSMDFGDPRCTTSGRPATRDPRVGCSWARPRASSLLRPRWPRFAAYPGKSEDIEKAHVVGWAKSLGVGVRNHVVPPGQLARFWPTLFEPDGRVHFVGAYADNLNWGMEAATRSAYRVSEAIDKA